MVGVVLALQAPIAPPIAGVDTPTPSSLRITIAAPIALALGYSVFRNGVRVATSVPMPWSDTGLTQSTTYTYTVATVGDNGEGGQSLPVTGTTSSPNVGIKWTPGHWLNSNEKTYLDDSKWANQQTEISHLSDSANIVGYYGRFFWGVLEPSTLGVYDFSKVDRMRNALPAGKHLCISIDYQLFGGGGAAQIVPHYMLTDSTYGPVYPASGQYGYWPQSSAGGGYTAAIWRTAVQDRFNACLLALLAHVNPTTGVSYDNDPYFDIVFGGESACSPLAGSDVGDYSGVVTFITRSIDAWNSVSPKTLYCIPNNFAATKAQTQTITNYCLAHRTAMGGPDIQWGCRLVTGALQPIAGNSQYTAIGGATNSFLTWGQKSAIGVGLAAYSGGTDANFTGSDLRAPSIGSPAALPFFNEFQYPEMATVRYSTSPSSMHSFWRSANDLLRQSHMFWTYLGNTGTTDPAYPADQMYAGANPGSWGQVLQVITDANCATQYTAKPSNLT